MGFGPIAMAEMMLPRPLIDAPSAWLGSELARRPEECHYCPSPTELTELAAPVQAIRGRDTGTLRRTDFPLRGFRLSSPCGVSADWILSAVPGVAIEPNWDSEGTVSGFLGCDEDVSIGRRSAMPRRALPTVPSLARTLTSKSRRWSRAAS
jgi:hypothetical protein